MLRFLQTVENKPQSIITASENMTRGAVVAENYANETVAKATGTLDFYFVDVEEVREGINAFVEPTDDTWETIKANDKVFKVVPMVGERYATTEFASALTTKGTPVKPSAGKFVAASAGDTYKAVFMGTYSDPTFATGQMGIIQIVETSTVPSN